MEESCGGKGRIHCTGKEKKNNSQAKTTKEAQHVSFHSRIFASIPAMKSWYKKRKKKNHIYHLKYFVQKSGVEPDSSVMTILTEKCLLVCLKVYYNVTMN